MRLAYVAVAIACAACGPSRTAEPIHVPAQWRLVRTTRGHLLHVGKVACDECHAESFAPPPPDVCVRCHALVTPLHHTDPTLQTPTCEDCHDFGHHPATTSWSCMRCHAQDQGKTAAIGAHADQPCADCHQPHAWPGTSPRACIDCHANRQTEHAGLRGCRDCHSVHEATRVTLASIDPASPPPGPGARCERCHAGQPGKLRVDTRAITTGHPDCTSCHLPHGPHGFAARRCGECHRNQAELAAGKHTCTGCHDPHDRAAAKPCTTCHREVVAHPNPTKSPLGSCVGCHPPHDAMLALATAPAQHGSPGLACATCHHQVTHATAKCLDCHTAHGGKPTLAVGLCARCHADQTTPSAGTGHARCSTCHTGDIHGPQPKPPACASCHAPEAASAPRGHADCAQCHQPHAPKPVARCAQCHASEAANGHGPRVACASCHRAHGPAGVAAPPPCASCHAKPTLAGLHQTPKHGECGACHRAHENKPADDRASCTRCHTDRKAHEPTAARCATCHPFR